MQNRRKALNLLGLALRAEKLILGTQKVLAQLKKSRIKGVVVACDLHPNSEKKIISQAQKKGVPVIKLFSASELEQAIGRPRKVLALTDQGFWQAFVKKINEGEGV